MHVHTVLVKLEDPATLDRCRMLMESMRGRIDGMVELDVQVNNLAGSFSCDLSLTTTWTDQAAYERYTTDPVHLEVRQQVLDLTTEAMTIDYTSESGGDGSS
ncbi:MAG: Dabb family protein [Acidimicrobiales bacterium]